MKLRPGKLLASFFVLVGIALLVVGLWWQAFVATVITPTQPQIVVITPGTSFTHTALQLEQVGVISDARRFALLARWHQATGKIHAGEYLFEAASGPKDILDRLVAGDVRKSQVTIPEGLNLKEISVRIEQAGISSAAEFLALTEDPELCKRMGVETSNLEGYLFPETYTVDSGTTPAKLLQLMLTQLQVQLTSDLLDKAREHGLNRHQLITLASIVQKEAGNVMEMPLIAAVFHNRLRKGIPLQADPTVIYDAANYNGNLTRRHLETSTPYNTYRKRGLPPGPIASPGLAALAATADPAASNSLYFVSRGDGTHQFSATLKEHNRAVRQYQLRH